MNTPCTPVRVFKRSIFVKLEYLQVGGSHKARAAKRVISDAESSGLLRRDGKHLIIEKSGGNFGVGLASHGIPAGYRVKLVVRPSFSGFRRYLLTQLGVDLIGRQEMVSGSSNQQIIDLYIEKYRRDGLVPFFSDQFNNRSCIKAHESGADELVRQLFSCGVSARENLTLVKCVGSGASLCAYSRVLRKGFPNLKVVVVQPEGCDFIKEVFATHPFEGASVGLVPPFLAEAPVDEYVTVKHEDAIAASAELFSDTGVFGGRTTGLAFAGAKQIAERAAGPTVMLAYDAGETYTADAYRRTGNLHD
jgi:cysteine synthase